MQLGGQVEIDVATFRDPAGNPARGSGTATALWAPPQPSFVGELDQGALDTFEVRIFSDEARPTLTAAIELVSPANKDRPGHRNALVLKCAAYLQQGVSVIIVDAVTSRSADLHGELLRLLALTAAPVPEPALFAAAYRTVARADRTELEAWRHALQIAGALPTLPLWLLPDYSLPLDLERSYTETCRSLRIER